jgi:hypothetical protein
MRVPASYTEPVFVDAMLFAFAAGPQAKAQSPWFPLEVGNTWLYIDLERPEGTRSVSVKREEAGVFTVLCDEVEVAITGDLDILLPGEAPAIYYRFDDPSFLHRDFRLCDDLRVLTVMARDETVSTPLGEFLNCLRIESEPGLCADSGTGVEWWAPEVGRVKWVEESFGGPRTYVLAEFSRDLPDPGFRRGDANGGGSVDITDAISVLEWLFVGGEAPPCSDAADSNDDGKVDLSDPVGVLGYLFLGGPPPADPGPSNCGADPTEDALPKCGAQGCEPIRIAGD